MLELTDCNNIDYLRKTEQDPDSFVRFYISIDKKLRKRNLINDESVSATVLDFLESRESEYRSLRQQMDELVAKLQPNELMSSIKENFLEIQQLKNGMQQQVSSAFNNAPELKLHESEHDRISKAILSTKQIFELCNTIENVKSKIDDLDDKFKGSTKRGEYSQNMFEDLLNTEFSTCEIQNTTSDSHNGDFYIIADNKPKVLVELKDYTKNVPRREIEKFISDVTSNNCCGILVSNRSGISQKKDFSVEVIDTSIVVYIHNCNYDTTFVRTAYDVITNMYAKMVKADNDDRIHIDREAFEIGKMQYEAHLFDVNKGIRNLKDTINLFTRGRLDILNKIMDTTIQVTNQSPSSFVCEHCNKTLSSNQGLHNHIKRYHTLK